MRVWIIGASSGIGEALAKALAKEGADLVLSARNAEALEQLVAECGSAQSLPLDLSDIEAFHRLCRTLPKGTFDQILMTAALYDPGTVEAVDLQAVEKLLRVNVLGTFSLAQYAPQLLRPNGQFVLFGSVAGYFGLPNGQPYSATKAAIINLAETLRIEWEGRFDVRLVCPGFVRTRLTAKNDFNMPALLTAEEAAQAVLKGLRGRAFEIHFPRRFTLALKLLRALPYRLAFLITRRLR